MVRDDLPGEEAVTPPWRRRSNLMLLLTCALVASLAAGPIVRDFFPVSASEPTEAEPKRVSDIAAEWDVAVPDGLGEVVYSQVVPGHVLVAGRQGFAVLESATGEKLWSERYDWEDPDRSMAGHTARESLRVVGDALLVAIPPESRNEPKPVRVLDLHTGEQRYAVREADDEDLQYAATVEALVIETCDDSENCVLSGLSWEDGDRKWRFESKTEAKLPVDVPQGGVEGQTDLSDLSYEAFPVPSKALALTIDYSLSDKVRYQVIDLADGKPIRQWDVKQDGDETPEYLVAGPLLVEYTDAEPAAALIDPETGKEVHSLRGLGAGSYSGRLMQTMMDESLLIDVYPVEPEDAEDGYDEFRIIDVDSGQVPMETESAAGFLLGGELGTVVMLTGTGAKGRPGLHGLDVETGDKRWTTSLYPEGTDMNGFNCEAVAMFDNHLAITGGPSSWTGAEFFGGARTHLVDLETGELWRIDDTQVQALGHNSMLGLRDPSTHEDDDGEPRLVFYQL